MRAAIRLSMLPLLAMPVAGYTATLTAKVRGTAGPWDPAINRNMPYGKNDQSKPVIVPILNIRPGTMIQISADGFLEYTRDGESIGPDGNRRIDPGRSEGGGAGYPSQYVDRSSHRPRAVGQLMGAFVDADGVIVGLPFIIGSQAKVEVPKGAMGLSLGIDDWEFRNNDGMLNVKITSREAQVTVE